jgi:hypothetical protein
MSRLEQTAVTLGPQDVFRWIFGESSLYYRQAEGKTWQDLGHADPKEALKKILGKLKTIA